MNEFLTVKCWIVAVMNVTLMEFAQRGIEIFLSEIFNPRFLMFFQLYLTRFQDMGNVAVNVGEDLLVTAFLVKNSLVEL